MKTIIFCAEWVLFNVEKLQSLQGYEPATNRCLISKNVFI